VIVTILRSTVRLLGKAVHRTEFCAWPIAAQANPVELLQERGYPPVKKLR